MRNNKKRKNKDSFSEEENEQYMMNLYNLSYIVGYTSGGVPYGVSNDSIEMEDIDDSDECFEDNDDIPF